MKCMWIQIKFTGTNAVVTAALVSACAAVLVVGTLPGPLEPSAHAATIFDQASPGPDALGAAWFVRDLSPGVLATAGVSGEATTGVLASAALASSDIAAVASARDEHARALAYDSEIRAEIRRGGLTPGRAAALAQAESRLAAATAALEAAEEGLRGVAMAALVDRVGADNAALAQRAASNLSRRVPDAWKVLDLPPDSPVWRTFESAWFKAQRGLPDTAFTQAERDALAMAQADTTVALAQQRLDANLAGVEAAWRQFITAQTQQPN